MGVWPMRFMFYPLQQPFLEFWTELTLLIPAQNLEHFDALTSTPSLLHTSSETKSYTTQKDATSFNQLTFFSWSGTGIETMYSSRKTTTKSGSSTRDFNWILLFTCRDEIRLSLWAEKKCKIDQKKKKNMQGYFKVKGFNKKNVWHSTPTSDKNDTRNAEQLLKKKFQWEKWNFWKK